VTLQAASEPPSGWFDSVESEGDRGREIRRSDFWSVVGMEAKQRCDEVVVARLRVCGKALDQGGRTHPSTWQVRRGEEWSGGLSDLSHPADHEPESGLCRIRGRHRIA